MEQENAQDVHENPLSAVFSSVPEFARLGISAKSQVCHFLERRILKFDVKLHQSPYVPCRSADPFNINHNFGEAFRRWLIQFPEEHRLGLLHAGMSVTYITKPEFDVFVEIASEQLFESIIEDEIASGRPEPTRKQILERIRAYPVSEFGGYDQVVHEMQVSGSRDRDKRIFRATIGDVVHRLYQNLRPLVENKDKVEFIYYEQHADEIQQAIMSFLNGYVVLVEDYSYSGTRIEKDTQRFGVFRHFSGLRSQV